jgi:hypothetical protein
LFSFLATDYLPSQLQQHSSSSSSSSSSFSFHALSNIAWGVANAYAYGMLDIDDNEIDRLFDSIADAALHQLSSSSSAESLPPSHLANIAWSYATMNVRNDKVR